MNPRTHQRFVLAAALAALVGCTTVGPDHHPPAIDTGAGWSGSPALPVADADLAHWWVQAGDAELVKLVQTALAHNPDLRQAAANLQAARAQLDRVQANREPVVTASASVLRRQLSENAPEFNPQRPTHQTVGDAGFDASWEIDLFGALARQRESAAASLQASDLDRAGLQISVAAEVARSYLQLRGAQRELAARETGVQALHDLHRLAQGRWRLGDATRADADQALARLQQAQAQLPALQAQVRGAAMALATLLGERPESRLALLDTPPPEPMLDPVPVGERADVLRRRPDVMAAERRLAAATADIGVATAELFPHISLGASLGLRSLGLSRLVDTGSVAASAGPLIRWRVFDGGRVRAEIRAADARQTAAALGYEKSVLVALADAERALDGYARSLEAVQAQQKALASARRVADTVRRRQALGDVPMADRLDQERELADQEALLVRAQTTASIDRVALYKSLGGGWTVAAPVR